MRQAHTVAQVRQAEAALLAVLPEGALMQRAAAGLAYAVIEMLGSAYGKRVALLVGSGDNGGDALFAGAMLARRGCAVEAVLLADQVHPDGVAALLRAGGTVRGGVDPASRRVGGVDLVIDGIVGIGGRPGLRAEAIEALADFGGVPVVAVDVPSGVEVDTGRTPDEYVQADLTVAFGTYKVAHLVDPAAAACGVVRLVDLGLELPPAAVTALSAADVRTLLPVPGGDDHKYTRGVVGIRAGSETYPGAALLCVAGAGSGLAGMVRYDGPATVAGHLRAAHPEVVVGPGRVHAWVIGSGGAETAERALRRSIAEHRPLVIDADSLAYITGPLGVPAVLTPHAGELARMLGISREEVESDQLACARSAAERFDAVVMLKGRHTLTVAPDGRTRVTTTGNPWLATAGAGDVLAGLTGALLAAGLSCFDAASAASWLHGAAATAASRGGPVRAGDVAAAIPAAVRGLVHGA